VTSLSGTRVTFLSVIYTQLPQKVSYVKSLGNL
jgi:hypothetical protein